MNFTPLFYPDDRYTDEALKLEARVEAFVEALVKEYEAAGYSLRDVEYIIGDVTQRVAMFERVARKLAGC